MVTIHASKRVSKLIFHLLQYCILVRPCDSTQIVLFLVSYGKRSRFDQTFQSMAVLLRFLLYRVGTWVTGMRGGGDACVVLGGVQRVKAHIKWSMWLSRIFNISWRPMATGRSFSLWL